VAIQKPAAFSTLSFSGSQEADVVERTLIEIKIAVNQSFDTVDEIKFEAALAAYAIETKYKQKEYAS